MYLHKIELKNLLIASYSASDPTIHIDNTTDQHYNLIQYLCW